ncbi:hypothetical protein [Bacillus solitudinis]|uniref:hypothetical protein n=1 Tax=Bacillus solitudinis TaxID=2014074 RepID=UPI000C23A900|nr:hypothetical protein [Bacillus solitudinis]
MSKKEKKPLAIETAKRLITIYMKDTGESYKDITQGTIKGKLGNFYICINEQGFRLFKLSANQKEIIQEGQYHWNDFDSVTIDKFATTTLFNFSGKTLLDLKINMPNTFIQSINSQEHIKIEIVSRKWVNKILGFRSKKRWKMVTASIFYSFIALMFIGIANSEPSTEVTAISEPLPVENLAEEVSSNVEEPIEIPEESPTEFEAKLDIEQTDGQVTLTANTNAPDGSIFEMSVLNSNFDIESDFIEVKDGVAAVTFDLSTWDVGYLSAMVNFPFNYDENPQPEAIKTVYGTAGENMTGDLASANNIDGFNGGIQPITFPYPDEKTVKAQTDKIFNEAISEMISLSEGIIVEIMPRLGGNDWRLVDVIVSDNWYYSAPHEKERFAEQIGGLVQQIVLNSGKAEGSISVYFKDTYNKELATPKMLGGYKIKE